MSWIKTCHYLTTREVNDYGIGHIYGFGHNVDSAENENGYGAMEYYSSEMCRAYEESGCTTDYEQSEIKYVVDAWKTAKAPAATEVRLISKDEIETERKEYDCCGGCGQCINTGDFAKYDWIYNNNYWYWTNTPYTDSSSHVWGVSFNGELGSVSVYDYGGVVRPVITISKSVISNTGN